MLRAMWGAGDWTRASLIKAGALSAMLWLGFVTPDLGICALHSGFLPLCQDGVGQHWAWLCSPGGDDHSSIALSVSGGETEAPRGEM